MNNILFHVLQFTLFVFVMFFGFNFLYEGLGDTSYFPEELRVEKKTALKVGIVFSVLGALLILAKLVFLSM